MVTEENVRRFRVSAVLTSLKLLWKPPLMLVLEIVAAPVRTVK
jgi:hypothetical protein